MSNYSNEGQTEQISEQTITILLNGKKSVENPVMDIFVGQRGSARTTYMMKTLSKEKLDEAIYVNLDEYRAFKPGSREILSDDSARERYLDETEIYARNIASRLFDTALKEKYNIIFEHTFKNDNICNVIRKAKRDGYTINIHVLSTSIYESMLHNLLIYEAELNYLGYSRAIPLDNQIQEYEAMLKTLERVQSEQLYDNIEVVTQSGDNVFNSTEESVIDIVEYINSHREQSWTEEQYTAYQQTLTKVREMASLRNADEKYLNSIDEVGDMSRQISIVQRQSPKLDYEER